MAKVGLPCLPMISYHTPSVKHRGHTLMPRWKYGAPLALPEGKAVAWHVCHILQIKVDCEACRLVRCTVGDTMLHLGSCGREQKTHPMLPPRTRVRLAGGTGNLRVWHNQTADRESDVPSSACGRLNATGRTRLRFAKRAASGGYPMGAVVVVTPPSPRQRECNTPYIRQIQCNRPVRQGECNLRFA